MNQTGQQGMAPPSIINQETADSQPPSVHAPEASLLPIQAHSTTNVRTAKKPK